MYFTRRPAEGAQACCLKKPNTKGLGQEFLGGLEAGKDTHHTHTQTHTDARAHTHARTDGRGTTTLRY